MLLENYVDVAVVQETHIDTEENLKSRGRVAGYEVLGATYHHAYGCATYIRKDIENAHLISVNTTENIHIIVIKIENITIANVYKPPVVNWSADVIPTLPHPSVYIGDFNSHHTMWNYNENDENGDRLVEWVESNNLSLVFNSKDKGTFRSAAWKKDYNPDLCFVSQNSKCQPLASVRTVLGDFPHSQHRPVLVNVGIQIPIIRSIPKPRWNFRKSNWSKFSNELDKVIRWIPPVSENYDRFVGAVLSTAKKCMPRGFRKEYIPGWNKDCEDLYQSYITTNDNEIATELLQSLDKARRETWIQKTESLDFTRSSREAWSLLKKLGGCSPPNRDDPHVTPDQIASRIISLSRAPSHKQHTRKVKKELTKLKQQAVNRSEYSNDFTVAEINTALMDVKTGKSPGFDGIHPEFLVNCGNKTRKWLAAFFSHIMITGKLPKAFKKTKIIAVLKPGKSKDKPDSYRPIALLSCCYKLLERLILNRLGSKIHEITPIEQAGFRPSRSCTDQVLSLTTHIEAGFQQQLKTSVAFVDLTAAYDTVWKDGLLYKLMRIIPCRTMNKLINNMLSERYFQVVVGTKISKQKKLNNGLPQGSVLAPVFFNLYTSDLPITQSRKFIYADDLALATQQRTLTKSEQTLSSDLSIMNEYFKKWRLTPNPSKTEVSCFHLNNRLANTKLNVVFNEKVLHHQTFPKYLGVTLDRTLSFKRHLQNTAAKLRSRNNILQKLCGTTWGATATTLRSSALGLVYSAAEYCAPVWLNSPHVKQIDVQLNSAMRIITGCIRTTPLYWLSPLSHIAPSALRRQSSLLREYQKIISNPKLPIHSDIPTVKISRLKSRRAPILTAESLQLSNFRIDNKWSEVWNNLFHEYSGNFVDPIKKPAGMGLPRHTWRTLNRVRTGHGVCADSLYRWDKASSPQCDCGFERQTIRHIVEDCSLRAYNGNLKDFHDATQPALDWISNLDINL